MACVAADDHTVRQLGLFRKFLVCFLGERGSCSSALFEISGSALLIRLRLFRGTMYLCAIPIASILQRWASGVAFFITYEIYTGTVFSVVYERRYNKPIL